MASHPETTRWRRAAVWMGKAVIVLAVYVLSRFLQEAIISEGSGMGPANIPIFAAGWFAASMLRPA